MSRLSIEITPEEHRQIKAMAALQGKSIKDLVMERIFTKSEDADVEWAEFTSLLRDRIKKAKESEPLISTFTDIAKAHLESIEKSK